MIPLLFSFMHACIVSTVHALHYNYKHISSTRRHVLDVSIYLSIHLLEVEVSFSILYSTMLRQLN